MMFHFNLGALAAGGGFLLLSADLAAGLSLELQTQLINRIENRSAHVSYSHIEVDQPTQTAILRCDPSAISGQTRATNPKRARFELLCADGSTERFSAELSGTATVVVASTLIQRKESLGSHNLEMKTLPLTEIKGETIGQLLRDGQYMARRNYAVGQAINPRYIDVDPVVKKGVNLKSVARIGTLEVQVEVKALEDGAMGEMIKVQNIASKQIFYAKVVSQSVVVKE